MFAAAVEVKRSGNKDLMSCIFAAIQVVYVMCADTEVVVCEIKMKEWVDSLGL
jgi:hypothetical protein